LSKLASVVNGILITIIWWIWLIASKESFPREFRHHLCLTYNLWDLSLCFQLHLSTEKFGSLFLSHSKLFQYLQSFNLDLPLNRSIYPLFWRIRVFISSYSNVLFMYGYMLTFDWTTIRKHQYCFVSGCQTFVVFTAFVLPPIVQLFLYHRHFSH
jgi:hypothetical protein